MNARLAVLAHTSSALVVLLAAASTLAHAGPWWDSRWMRGDAVDVQVQVEGAPAPLLRAPGRDDRLYVQAREGREYAVVLANRTDRRVGVVLAVDGLNVLDGSRSDLDAHEVMYVLDPHERATIRGWRRNLDEVQRFVFVDEARSYASRVGRANEDMGWIRVASFEERPTRWSLPRVLSGDESSRGPNAPMRSAAPDAAEGYPGTGWGRRTSDPVGVTDFRAREWATDRLDLRYEYASALRALGIDCSRDDDRLMEREHGLFGFVPPPADERDDDDRGWHRGRGHRDRR